MTQDATPKILTEYHVQSTAQQIRDGFPYFEYHQSVEKLWSHKWRPLCAHQIYPFMDGDVSDFDPIFEQLVEASQQNPNILHEPDTYAAPFLPVGERLTSEADALLEGGDVDSARRLFLRAAAVYRIARFPIVRSPRTDEAWERGKAAYEQGGRLLNPPSRPIAIEFGHADTSRGDLDIAIPAYLRLPNEQGQEVPENGWPVLLFICGLDAYRTDHTPRTQKHVDDGFAVLSFEIPGTGDCPAAPRDPQSPDRLLSSILDWVEDHADEFKLDPDHVVARGISTGGYYSLRAAHTHASRLFASVSHGGGCHHMFDPEWINAQDQMEYPFDLAGALAFKFGFREGRLSEALAEYAANGHRFSLVEGGIIGTSACKLLLINGSEDSIFPIEDSILAGLDGRNKDLIVRGNCGHMGNPGAEELVYAWIYKTVNDAR